MLISRHHMQVHPGNRWINRTCVLVCAGDGASVLYVHGDVCSRMK